MRRCNERPWRHGIICWARFGLKGRVGAGAKGGEEVDEERPVGGHGVEQSGVEKRERGFDKTLVKSACLITLVVEEESVRAGCDRPGVWTVEPAGFRVPSAPFTLLSSAETTCAIARILNQSEAPDSHSNPG